MRVRALPAILALAVPCAGCGISRLVDHVGSQSQPGFISASGLVVPDTATRGVPFSVKIWTQGDGCIKSQDRTDVSYPAADTAVVQPYDDVSIGGCTNDVAQLVPHTASITFTQPGSAVVRFEGVNNIHFGKPTTIERTVIVH